MDGRMDGWKKDKYIEEEMKQTTLVLFVALTKIVVWTLLITRNSGYSRKTHPIAQLLASIWFFHTYTFISSARHQWVVEWLRRNYFPKTLLKDVIVANPIMLFWHSSQYMIFPSLFGPWILHHALPSALGTFNRFLFTRLNTRAKWGIHFFHSISLIAKICELLNTLKK